MDMVLRQKPKLYKISNKILEKLMQIIFIVFCTVGIVWFELDKFSKLFGIFYEIPR